MLPVAELNNKRAFQEFILIILLAAKTSAQEAFLKSILSKVGKCWSEFYKYVQRYKGNQETIPAIKDCNGRIITYPAEKANSLNFYYSTVFSSERNIPHILAENTDDPFTIDIKTIRKRIKAIGKNKPVGPDCVSGEILKLGWEAMIPYLAQLLDVTFNTVHCHVTRRRPQ
jgi:hypothetical protein